MPKQNPKKEFPRMQDPKTNKQGKIILSVFKRKSLRSVDKCRQEYQALPEIYMSAENVSIHNLKPAMLEAAEAFDLSTLKLQMITYNDHIKSHKRYRWWCATQASLNKKQTWMNYETRVCTEHLRQLNELKKNWDYMQAMAHYTSRALFKAWNVGLLAFQEYLNQLEIEVKFKRSRCHKRQIKAAQKYHKAGMSYIATEQSHLAQAMINKLQAANDIGVLAFDDVIWKSVTNLQQLGAIEKDINLPNPSFGLCSELFQKFHDCIAKASKLTLLQSKVLWLHSDKDYQIHTADHKIFIIPKVLMPVLYESKLILKLRKFRKKPSILEKFLRPHFATIAKGRLLADLQAKHLLPAHDAKSLSIIEKARLAEMEDYANTLLQIFSQARENWQKYFISTSKNKNECEHGDESAESKSTMVLGESIGSINSDMVLVNKNTTKKSKYIRTLIDLVAQTWQQSKLTIYRSINYRDMKRQAALANYWQYMSRQLAEKCLEALAYQVWRYESEDVIHDTLTDSPAVQAAVSSITDTLARLKQANVLTAGQCYRWEQSQRKLLDLLHSPARQCESIQQIISQLNQEQWPDETQLEILKNFLENHDQNSQSDNASLYAEVYIAMQSVEADLTQTLQAFAKKKQVLIPEKLNKLMQQIDLLAIFTKQIGQEQESLVLDTINALNHQKNTTSLLQFSAVLDDLYQILLASYHEQTSIEYCRQIEMILATCQYHWPKITAQIFDFNQYSLLNLHQSKSDELQSFIHLNLERLETHQIIQKCYHLIKQHSNKLWKLIEKKLNDPEALSWLQQRFAALNQKQSSATDNMDFSVSDYNIMQALGITQNCQQLLTLRQLFFGISKSEAISQQQAMQALQCLGSFNKPIQKLSNSKKFMLFGEKGEKNPSKSFCSTKTLSVSFASSNAV